MRNDSRSPEHGDGKSASPVQTAGQALLVFRLACVLSGWVSQRSVAFSKLMFNFVNEYSLGAFHQNYMSYPKVHTVDAILLKEKSSARN